MNGDCSTTNRISFFKEKIFANNFGNFVVANFSQHAEAVQLEMETKTQGRKEQKIIITAKTNVRKVKSKEGHAELSSRT